MAKDAVVVMVTCPSMKEAGRIAEMLVRKKLAACANAIPGIRSIFRWKGKVEKAKEVLVIAKTDRSKFAMLDKEVRRAHSYDVPEIIAVRIAAGSSDYLKWIADSVK
jgi:periplasmic divalent cation tolerance protein